MLSSGRGCRVRTQKCRQAPGSLASHEQGWRWAVRSAGSGSVTMQLEALDKSPHRLSPCVAMKYRYHHSKGLGENKF